ERLEAAAVAAPADRALRIDQDVADLARDAARPAKRSPTDDEPGADAGGETQVGHDLDALAGPERRLAERPDVRVVVEVDGQPEALLHLGGGVDPVERRDDRAGVHEPGLAVD